MTQNTEREAGGGQGDEYRCFLCLLGLRGELGEVGGGDRMVPAIHTSVMCSASEGAETMLVTVGDRDSWLSH